MKTRSFLAVLVCSMLLFTACVPSLPFISSDGEEEEVVARPVRSVERPTVKVERGSIIDAVRVLGRVVAESEEGLFFKQNGRLKGIYVQYNQAVVQGTLLADLETGALETQIQNSELSLQDQERNLSKARTQAATVKLLLRRRQGPPPWSVLRHRPRTPKRIATMPPLRRPLRKRNGISMLFDQARR